MLKNKFSKFNKENKEDLEKLDNILVLNSIWKFENLFYKGKTAIIEVVFKVTDRYPGIQYSSLDENFNMVDLGYYPNQSYVSMCDWFNHCDSYKNITHLKLIHYE